MKTIANSLEPLAMWNVLGLAAVLMLLGAANDALALTVVSEPVFAPAANAPLAGVLTLTTDTDSLVSVTVNDGTSTWQRDFLDYGTTHSETLLGFKANMNNEITVTVHDGHGKTLTLADPLNFVTGPLPADMPTFTVLTDNVEQMEPGYMLFNIVNGTTGDRFAIILNNSGEVVWYSSVLPTFIEVRRLTNGDLFFPEISGAGFAEVNMLGQTVRTWVAPFAVDVHEDLMTDHGTIIYLTDTTQIVDGFPSSATDSDASPETANVVCENVVEISAADSSLLNVWTLIDMLDPVRIDYLCFAIPPGIDAEHANAVIEDQSDDSLIVSVRNQDAIVKFTRAGQIKWILGPPQNWGPEWQPYLLTPVGTPFAWNFAQHDPILTREHTLMFYDDGNCRAEPFAPPIPDQDNYSRAAEFKIDETKMEVSQVWEFSDINNDRLYTGFLGSARELRQTGNVLVNFGAVSYENGTHPQEIAPGATIVRIKEVTHEDNPSVVFDLELSYPNNTNPDFAGCYVYRCYHIHDLYGRQIVPAANLTTELKDHLLTVKFSGDPVASYVVQGSADGAKWHVLGVAAPDDANGDFSYQEEVGDDFADQFFRVLEQ